MNKLIAIFATFVLISTASAQTNTPSPAEKSGTTNYGSTEKIAFVGGLAGYGTGNNSFNGFTWGATLGSKLTDMFGWDVYFSSTSEDFLPGVSQTAMPLVADFNFFLPEGWMNLYVGPRVGVGFIKTDLGVLGSTTNTDFALGAQIGSDFFLADAFSVGVNVNWNHIFADSNVDLFNFVVPLKVWF